MDAIYANGALTAAEGAPSRASASRCTRISIAASCASARTIGSTSWPQSRDHVRAAYMIRLHQFTKTRKHELLAG